jgi:hypothetical protein
MEQSQSHIADLKARLAKLEGKPPAGLIDTAELKAQVHKDLEGFAKELFKDLRGYTNVKGTYYYVTGVGKMSLTTGAFFDTQGAMLRPNNSTDVIELWRSFKDITFPEALRDIKRWLCTSGSIASVRRRKRLKEKGEKEARKNLGNVLFKEGEDVIADSASGILKRLGCLDLITVKEFAAKLRIYETENRIAAHRGHLIVIEKPIGNLRGDKGGKSKFTFIRYASPAFLDWYSAEAGRLNKEEEEQYQASLRRKSGKHGRESL